VFPRKTKVEKDEARDAPEDKKIGEKAIRR